MWRCGGFSVWRKVTLFLYCISCNQLTHVIWMKFSSYIAVQQPVTYNLKLQCRFFRHLEFQPPPLKHTYSLDVKFGLRCVGLPLLNHVKRLDPFEQLAWSAFFFCCLWIRTVLIFFFFISLQKHPDSLCCFQGAVPLILAGGSWSGDVDNVVQMFFCVFLSLFFFLLPSAFALVLWLLSVWEWIAGGRDRILIHLSLHV